MFLVFGPCVHDEARGNWPTLSYSQATIVISIAALCTNAFQIAIFTHGNSPRFTSCLNPILDCIPDFLLSLCGETGYQDLERSRSASIVGS